MKKIKWFRFTNKGPGSQSAHAHLRTDFHGEIEFQCGLQRHMDDTILSSKNKCRACLNYLRHNSPFKEWAKRKYTKLKKQGWNLDLSFNRWFETLKDDLETEYKNS